VVLQPLVSTERAGSYGLPYVSQLISARQFQQQNLVKTIVAFSQKRGLNLRYLEIEITESICMHRDYTISVLQELQEMDIQIAMDDFGIGYFTLLPQTLPPHAEGSGIC